MRLLVISALLVFGSPFIMTKVVDSFQTCSSFFQGSEPLVIPGVLERSVSQDNNRYKLICQQYKGSNRFATLYDISNKIPVFSAYRYTGHHKGRARLSWMIEPQLEVLGDDMREPCVNQAYTGDYWKSNGVDRGHLFPNGHAADKDTEESTFTLTNTVPQYISFNNGSWLQMEQNVRSIMDSHCHDIANSEKTLAFVVTGAVPSPSTKPLLNKKVNIPSHMWTAFCCYNKNTKIWASQAHWALNNNEEKLINAKTLEKLQDFLRDKYIPGSVLFNSGCSAFLQVTGDQFLDTYPEDEETKTLWATIKSLPEVFWAWIRG